MRILLAFVLLQALVWSQNPVSPLIHTKVLTDEDILVPSNRSSTNLSAGIGPTDTTIPVDSTSGFTVPTIIWVNREAIAVCSKTSTTFTVCTNGRAFDSTSAYSHQIGSIVSVAISAYYVNRLAAEVKKLSELIPNYMTGAASSTDGQLVQYNGTTGKASKALGLTGVLVVNNGVPGVVSGNVTDCVRVDGTSGACGGGGSSWSGSVNLTEILPGRVGYGDFTATGATVGTALAPVWPDMEAGLVGLSMRVVSSNTIRVYVLNESNSSIDPALATFGASAQGGFAAGGDSTVVSNSGTTGASVLKTGTNVVARKIKAGANVTVLENTDDIEISASGGGGSFPDATGKGYWVLRANSAGTGYELAELKAGAGSGVTNIDNTVVFSVDSYQVPYKALNNSFLGHNTFQGKTMTYPSGGTQTLTADAAIVVTTTTMKQVSSASAITMTAAPTIADGDDGQQIWLVNVGDYSITLRDESMLANSNLCTISNSDIVLDSKAAVQLLFSSAAGCWIEVR